MLQQLPKYVTMIVWMEEKWRPLPFITTPTPSGPLTVADDARLAYPLSYWVQQVQQAFINHWSMID